MDRFSEWNDLFMYGICMFSISMGVAGLIMAVLIQSERK